VSALAGPPMRHRLAAEVIGTFWLVFAGCGSAVIASSFRSSGFPVGIGYLGVGLTFGLTVVTMAYAVGHVSGGHFNPAITLGLAASGRFSWRDVLPYVVAQVVAAIGAAALLWVIASGTDSFPGQAGGFASNGYGDRSPGGYSLLACALSEVVFTAFFLLVILGSTDTRAPRGFAPLAIGLSLTLIHLVSIPITNTSVNPARSTGPAIFAGADALGQLWLFWVAPLAGGLIAGLAYAWLLGRGDTEPSPLEVATEA
jgi:aquaporin Z